jgi:EpsI family protein
MKNTAIRIVIVISLVVVGHLMFYAVLAGVGQADVKLPARGIDTIPMQFGGWQGTPEELEAKIFVNTGARDVITRKYLDRHGHRIAAFVALCTSSQGLYHSPTNCYRTQGWNLLEISRPVLKTKTRPDTPVSLSAWEKEGDRIYVLYWYELGDHTLFERSDMLTVRWAMLGKRVWPPMYKVLLQTSAPDADTAKAWLFELAASLRTELSQLDAAPVAAPGQ